MARYCAGTSATFALDSIAGDEAGGSSCYVVTLESYWIVKGANRVAQEGHWTVGERYCGGGGGFMCCG
jgi:hypothetical protein